MSQIVGIGKVCDQNGDQKDKCCYICRKRQKRLLVKYWTLSIYLSGCVFLIVTNNTLSTIAITSHLSVLMGTR